MTLAHPSLTISREELAAFCQRWGIKELSLFGSAARGELRPDSDVDFMIDFDGTVRIGLYELVDIHDELAELLGREVDVIEKGTITNPFRKASIDRDLTVLYAA